MSPKAATRRRPWPVPAGLLTVLMAATGSAGAADTAIEAREVSGIHRVVMRAVGELNIRQGEREHLEIEAEPRLLPMISSEVREGILYLEFRSSQINTTHPLRFRLTVTRLEGLDSVASADVRVAALRTDSFHLRLIGSGDVAIESLDAARVETHLTGAGDISIDGGRVEQQTLLLRGSGDYVAGALGSRKASVTIEGSGNATVSASEQLIARIAGSGDVRYYGNPRVERTISGAGSVSAAE